MTDMNDLSPDERDEIRSEARDQVIYEKAVVDAMVMKSKFVVETLQAAGYCEDHVAGMVQPIMLASVLQQIFEVLEQIEGCHGEMLNTLKEMREQHESSQRHLGALAKYGIDIKK